MNRGLQRDIPGGGRVSGADALAFGVQVIGWTLAAWHSAAAVREISNGRRRSVGRPRGQAARPAVHAYHGYLALPALIHERGTSTGLAEALLRHQLIKQNSRQAFEGTDRRRDTSFLGAELRARDSQRSFFDQPLSVITRTRSLDCNASALVHWWALRSLVCAYETPLPSVTAMTVFTRTALLV